MSFESDYLDLAIGLAVVFFLASLVVSGLNEALAWLLRRRAKFLWAWLYDLVSDDAELTWKPKDVRPATSGAGGGPGAPPTSGVGGGTATPATDGAGGGPALPALVTSRLLRALGPVSPTDAKKQHTTIKHIPPSSLAQAFLEVLGDLGRETLARDLPALLSAEDAERRRGAEALGALLARPPDRPAADVQDAFRAFADANASADQDVRAGAVDGLVAAIGGLSGARGVGGLRDAVQAFVDAPPDARQQPAEGVISGLARAFPDVFVRERLHASIQALDGTPLAPTLKRLWDTSTGEMDKFREQFEQWLQGELDRLGGFYKRSIRWITLIFVVAVTVVLNLDAIGVTQSLWRHPEGRTALVGFAQQLGTEGADAAAPTAPAPSGDDAPPASTPAATGLAAVRAACEVEHAPPTTAASAGGTTASDPEAAARTFTDISNCVTDAVNALSGLDVIDTALVVSAGKWWDSWSTWGWLWWRHLVGLVTTVAVLFLGAPFWFDIVKRLTGIRKGAVGNT
jgi:hypothetical protein